MLVVVLAGCQVSTPTDGGRVVAAGGGGQGAVDRQLAPVSLRVYPLTRVERIGDGPPMIVCHVELKDRWGDSVKGLGLLVVQLYRVGTGLEATEAEREKTWEVDLTGADRNAELYDPATRTYRVALMGIPAWVGGSDDGGSGRALVRVVFTPVGSGGQVLRDEYLIE